MALCNNFSTNSVVLVLLNALMLFLGIRKGIWPVKSNDTTIPKSLLFGN